MEDSQWEIYTEFHRKNPNLYVEEALIQSESMTRPLLEKEPKDLDDYNEAFTYLIYFCNFISCTSALHYTVKNELNNDYVFTIMSGDKGKVYFKETSMPIWSTGIKQVSKFNKYLANWILLRNCLAHPTSTNEVNNVLCMLMSYSSQPDRLDSIDRYVNTEEVLRYTKKMESYWPPLIKYISAEISAVEKGTK